MLAPTLNTDAGAHRTHAGEEIETERLRLRMFRQEDLDALSEITRDPEVMRHIAEGRPLTREETSSNLDSIISAFRRRGFGRWALESRATGALVGYCGLSLSNDEVGVELAYMLARGAWGRGLAQESGRAALRYAFERLGLEEVAGLTLHDNWRSRRVLERLDMSFVRAACFYGFDCVQYRIRRADWRDDGAQYQVVSRQ